MKLKSLYTYWRRNKLKISLSLSFFALIIVGWAFYPRLDLLTGFAAKNACSCTFESGSEIATIEAQDNNFVPVSFAVSEIDHSKKSATASLLGLKRRRAVFTPGIGCTLLPEGDSKEDRVRRIPQRTTRTNFAPYPFGTSEPGDTLFSEVNYEELRKGVTKAFAPENQTRAVLVLYKDHLLIEKYSPGFSKSTRLPGWSMTKSVTSSVLGVLEKQGKIDLEQDELFEEWKNDTRSEITLRNLLQMNSGLQWKEDYTKVSDVTKMLFMEQDMGQVQIDKPLDREPGNCWNYSSGTTNLLSRFIRDQFPSHQKYLDFWYSAFIDRIGMHSMMIETDLAGNFVGSSYAWATARDWGKFGLFYLNDGKWNGEQIINKSWIDFSRTPNKGSNGEFGGHFWLNAGRKYPDVPKDLFSANGFQGQYVFIIPSRDLVVVRLGLTEDPEFDVNGFLSGIVGSLSNHERQILANNSSFESLPDPVEG